MYLNYFIVEWKTGKDSLPPREKRSVVYAGARILTGLFSVRTRARIVCSWCLAGVRKPSYRVRWRRVQLHIVLLHLLLFSIFILLHHLLFTTRVRISPAGHRPQTTAARTGGRWPWNIKYIIVIIIIIFNNINDERDFERRNDVGPPEGAARW